MSALGHKRTWAVQLGMSALCHSRTSASLFDHLVGAGKQERRHSGVESLRRLEIDHQFILGRSLHREIGRLSALEDAVDVIWCLAKLFGEIGTISDQTA